MRKNFFICLVVFILISVFHPVFAWDVKTTAELQTRMNSVGFRILNANRIEQRFTFMAINRVYTRDFWTDVSSVNRIVWVKPVIIPYIDSDDELAAVLSHSLAHGVDNYE